MSCLRQRRFPNPIKDERRTGYDKYVITGNCGNCANCKKRKQNDWLVRSYFEYMSEPRDWYFITLDFDEDHLPRFKDKPCFDSHIMTRFFESLRQALDSDFRYIYSSHFGDALNRPHYHTAIGIPKGLLDPFFVETTINRIWHYGSHTRIDQLRSVKGNPLAAFEYICKYTTLNKKFLYDADKLKMPARYRPRTISSIGFGAQCLDPKEFRSDRFIKEGLVFCDRPVLTRDYLLNNSLIYIDIKQDGILVPFAIPQYYVYKLMYDSSYDPETKRTSLIKNDYGRELQILQHNADYLNTYAEFELSRNQKIHEDCFVSEIYQAVFPNSPYNGVAWCDIVDDCLIDKDKFFEFCKIYKHLEFDCSLPGYNRYRPLRFYKGSTIPGKRDRVVVPHARSDSSTVHLFDYKLRGYTLSCAELDGSFLDIFDDDIDLYVYALSYFQIWKDVERLRKADFEDWKLQEQIKDRVRQRAKNDLSFYWHLRRSNFKFYKLNPSTYVPRYQARKNRVQVES